MMKLANISTDRIKFMPKIQKNRTNIFNGKHLIKQGRMAEFQIIPHGKNPFFQIAVTKREKNETDNNNHIANSDYNCR